MTSNRDSAWPDMSHATDRKDASASTWFGSVGNVFWLYPLITGSYLIASTWSVGIAEAAFMAQGIKPHPKGGSETAWIEYAVRTVLILNYSLICFALQNLPVVGRILSFLVMSFVDGFFCFEQIWSVRGWPLEKRLRFAESHWSFLMGFGIPSTMISFFHPSGLLNLMLFMLVFPICTLLAYLAVPQPQSTSFGAQTAMLPSTMPGRSHEPHLSLFLPARIPLFWPTVRVRRWLLSRIPPAVPPKPIGVGMPRRSMSTMPAPTTALPRRSAASFVGGAWSSTPKGRMVSAPVLDKASMSYEHNTNKGNPLHASAVSIPMSEALEARKMQKRA